MKFKVLEKSFLFGELVDAGSIFDYPDGKLPRNSNGDIRFEKLPQLEPLEKEKKSTTSHLDNGLTDEQKAEAIEEAVASLDKSVDAHWTKGGLPDVMAVKEIVGFEVTRKDIEAVAGGITRPTE